MVTKTKKIFIGGLSAATTVDDVKNYFQQYGKVTYNYEVQILDNRISVFKLLSFELFENW